MFVQVTNALQSSFVIEFLELVNCDILSLFVILMNNFDIPLLLFILTVFLFDYCYYYYLLLIYY